MKIFLYFKIILICIILCFLISGHANILYLDEGAVCPVDGKNSSVCKLPENCPSLEQNIRLQKFPQLCSFIGNKPVVCCPTAANGVANAPGISTAKPNVVNSYSAAEMCRQYSELAYANVKIPWSTTGERRKTLDCYNVIPLIAGGTIAKAKEFPHMALLGYGSRSGENDKTWSCGGSLISDRWIMSAAHCAINNSGKTVSWAILGALNIFSDLDSDSARPREYEIVERVVHPQYNPSYVYNDIALFRLGSDVEFSAYVRPICLNTNETMARFTTASATGWGRISPHGPTSPDLLKVVLKQMDIKKCKYSYPPSFNPRINLGILEESMICAGDLKDGNDTCTGDSGGPLQVRSADYPCMYDQIGITSFGKYCGSKDTPGVYTRVSNYVAWIEGIVWPKS